MSKLRGKVERVLVEHRRQLPIHLRRRRLDAVLVVGQHHPRLRRRQRAQERRQGQLRQPVGNVIKPFFFAVAAPAE